MLIIIIIIIIIIIYFPSFHLCESIIFFFLKNRRSITWTPLKLKS